MQPIDSSRKWDDESGMDSSGESPLFGAAEIDSPYIDSARIGGKSAATSPRSGGFSLDKHGSADFSLPSSTYSDMYKLQGELAGDTAFDTLQLINSISSDESDSESDSEVDSDDEAADLMPMRECKLRIFADEAGLSQESRFLSHWFGLKNLVDEHSTMTEQLPRPTPWNMFVNDTTIAAEVAPSAKSGFELRAWAHDAGLAEDSKFLSHWFGLTDTETVLEDQLPRPSPWNYFSNETSTEAVQATKSGYELRAFAYDAGLPEESRFLSHWFGLTSAGTAPLENQLPRPSPWNYFVKEERGMPRQAYKFGVNQPRAEKELRAFAEEAGLAEDSKFLSHWFGLSKMGEKCATEQLPRPSPWNMFCGDNDAVAVEENKVKSAYALRAFAHDAGLEGDSLFLSHWFGITDTTNDPLEDQLPRPSPWNYFAHEDSEEVDDQVRTGFALRAWTHDAGLAEDSKFLSHWFGLTDTETVLEDQLPRPSPWNYFSNETSKEVVQRTVVKKVSVPRREAALRTFANEAGLPEDSQFLSHWFGLKKIGDELSASTEKLPRPSPWNMFIKDETVEVAEKSQSGFELRAFAHDAGLAEDSKFLSHWFGLTDTETVLEDQLPRPSPWNRFTSEAAQPVVVRRTSRKRPQSARARRVSQLRTWSANAGLPEESRFLSHWFGVTQIGEEGPLDHQLPRPSPWNRFVSDSARPKAEESAFELRAWAAEAGLSEQSRFLSHWFGVSTNNSAHQERLPRPSPWNRFVPASTEHVVLESTQKNGFELRAWAHDAGLAEDSKFLSHWFGLTDTETVLEDQLPRPSPWNYFSNQTTAPIDEVTRAIAARARVSRKKSTMPRRQADLRCFADAGGLAEDSLFLSHWFGMTQISDELSASTEKLPRPSPWNMFVKDETVEVAEKSQSGFELRAFAHDAGLAEDSKFLSHWFGLTDTETVLEDQLPRPSPWNYFSNETSKEVVQRTVVKKVSMPRREAALRTFADEAGLPEDSQFLSHWFGLKKIGDELSASTEKLPRPSPWNMFVKDETVEVAEKSQSGFELRAFAHDAGLAEDSKFLSHWFGLTDTETVLEDQLPRPSPWNYFSNQTSTPLVAKKSPFALRAWAMDSGLHEDSQFLSHWFGLKQTAKTVYTDSMGPATTHTAWVYVE